MIICHNKDMKKNFLVRAFFGVTIVALGGVLLLRNLEIIKFERVLGNGLGSRPSAGGAGDNS